MQSSEFGMLTDVVGFLLVPNEGLAGQNASDFRFDLLALLEASQR